MWLCKNFCRHILDNYKRVIVMQYNWSKKREQFALEVSKPKVGILIASYGSATLQSNKNLRNFQVKLEEYFGVPVRIALTSEALRKRLAHARTKSDSVLKALKKMEFERFTHVIVQSLHLIAGIEYNDVLEDTNIAREESVLKIQSGLPLLSSEQDILPVVEALNKLLPPDFQKNDVAIFMGHGTSHNAKKFYAELSEKLHGAYPYLYIACMEGSCTLAHVLEDLKQKPALHKVWLLPLLTSIGKHALCDMAGDEKNSWKNQVTAQGYACEPYLKGLAESVEIQNIWIKRIEQAILAL